MYIKFDNNLASKKLRILLIVGQLMYLFQKNLQIVDIENVMENLLASSRVKNRRIRWIDNEFKVCMETNVDFFIGT